MSAVYRLFSSVKGGSNVGIWYLTQETQDLTGQPVRLDVDLIEWVATPPITGGGPTRLTAGPYKYTQEAKEEVFATNEAGSGQVWFLIPGDYDNTYLIAADPRGNRVWTAGEPRDPISIAPFTGEPNQLFKFVPILGE